MSHAWLMRLSPIDLVLHCQTAYFVQGVIDCSLKTITLLTIDQTSMISRSKGHTGLIRRLVPSE